MDIAQRDRQRYYRAGVFSLRVLQDRALGPARFTPDADARWKGFRGDLTDSDRVDLLLRDGSAQFPLAFAASSIFALPDLAPDEPHGPDWKSLPPSEAGPLLRETTQGVACGPDAPASLVLTEVAKAWELATPFLRVDVAAVVAASSVVVAGSSAIAALADHMAGRPDMDFADQLLLITDQPAERQMFGLAAALCGSRTPPRTARSDDTLAAVLAMKFDRCMALVVSDDAEAATREAALKMAQGLGL